MMMAEAIATSASKRTLCLRRSILRMRFIAAPSRSGSAVPVALSSWSHVDLLAHWRRPREKPSSAVTRPEHLKSISHATTAIIIATTRPSVRHACGKLSSSIHRRIVHQKLGIYFGREEIILGRRCPDWPRDTVTQQGKTDTEAELSHRLAKRSGIVAVPSIQVGVKCIGNKITKRSEL